MFPVFNDNKARKKEKGHKQDKGNDHTSHENWVVKMWEAPQGWIIEGCPDTLQGAMGQNIEPDDMKKWIQQIGNPGKTEPPQNEGWQVDTQNKDQKQDDNIMKRPQRCQADYHPKAER